LTAAWHSRSAAENIKVFNCPVQKFVAKDGSSSPGVTAPGLVLNTETLFRFPSF
jgi:hypothetical protein